MRKSDLEKLVKEQGERIERLGIIPKSKEIAQKLGNGGSCSKKWASADYKFEGESLRIHYEVYAMGDQEIQVDYAEEHIWHEMFHAKEGSPIKFPNPLIVHDSRDNYEILKYKPGPWTRKIGTLYKTIGKALEARKQEKEKEDALAKDPEVPEDELKTLQDRLGIKK